MIETLRVVAVAKDGIQVLAVARVTVHTTIERLVGEAGEEMIIARVGEGTVSSIGSAESHKYVLENPGRISRYVLERELDAGTAYEILLIDITEVFRGGRLGVMDYYKMQNVQAATGIATRSPATWSTTSRWDKAATKRGAER